MSISTIKIILISILHTCIILSNLLLNSITLTSASSATLKYANSNIAKYSGNIFSLHMPKSRRELKEKHQPEVLYLTWIHWIWLLKHCSNFTLPLDMMLRENEKKKNCLAQDSILWYAQAVTHGDLWVTLFLHCAVLHFQQVFISSALCTDHTMSSLVLVDKAAWGGEKDFPLLRFFSFSFFFFFSVWAQR